MFADAVNEVSRVVSNKIVVSVLEPVNGVSMMNDEKCILIIHEMYDLQG